MMLSLIKGMKAEFATVIVFLSQLLFLSIYIQNEDRLQQSTSAINKLISNLEVEYQSYLKQIKDVDKQFSLLHKLKNKYNSKDSNKRLNEILLKHAISYHLKPMQNIEIKNDRPTWVARLMEVSLSIKHEVALLDLFSELQRSFGPYIILNNCKVVRVPEKEKWFISISKLKADCTIKIYTLD